MSLERVIDGIDVGNLARLDGQVMPHETVEVRAVGFLPEIQLHRPPELLVKPRLQLLLQPHQDIIADEIGLAQLPPSGVHALENELRIVLVAIERDVHHHELGQAFAHGQKIPFAPGE